MASTTTTPETTMTMTTFWNNSPANPAPSSPTPFPTPSPTPSPSASAMQSMLQRPVMYFDPAESDSLDQMPSTNDFMMSTVVQHKYILIGLVHTLGLTLALVGNCSVIVIIARTRRLHTPSSLLVLLLAGSDLMLSLLWNLAPLMATFHGGVHRWFITSDVACNVIGFAWQTLLAVSTLSHCVVAFDRFLFIVHPMKYQVHVTIKATSMLACLVCFIALLLSSLTLVTGSHFRFRSEVGMCIAGSPPTWSVVYLVLVFIPSLTLALFAYQRIWRLCLAIFKQDSVISSRCHSPNLSGSYQLPALSSLAPSIIQSDLREAKQQQQHQQQPPPPPQLQQQHYPSTAEASQQQQQQQQQQDDIINRTVDNETQRPTSGQENVLTTVKTTTKITRKNTATTTTTTTTTTTIANTGHPSHNLPAIDGDNNVIRTHIIDQNESQVTNIQVKETSISRNSSRSESSTFHTRWSIPESSAKPNSQTVVEPFIETDVKAILDPSMQASAQGFLEPSIETKPQTVPEPHMKTGHKTFLEPPIQTNPQACLEPSIQTKTVLEPPIETNFQTFPHGETSASSTQPTFVDDSHRYRHRAFSKDSIINFLTRKQPRTPNPFIVTTAAAESISSIFDIEGHASSSLGSTHALPDPNPSPNRLRREMVTRKLFGSEAILPSLLYVAILMPLSMQPASPIYKPRRLKVCLLIGLPVFIMAVSFLPFPGALIYLGYAHDKQDNGAASEGVGLIVIKLICHLTFALVPSLTSLLLCLNNKPYRRALGQTLRCRCV